MPREFPLGAFGPRVEEPAGDGINLMFSKRQQLRQGRSP
jgi:hypothetical protein